MEDAEQTRCWNKENWIDALSRSSDKPRMESCEDQDGTIIHIRAFARPQSRSRNQSRRVLFGTDAVALQRTYIPHGRPFQLQINPGEWSMGRGI